MTHRARLVLSLFVLMATVAPPSRAAGTPELEGWYVSTGVNPDGSEYRGLVRIAAHGDSFVLRWTFPEAANEAMLLAPVSFGVGVRSGDVLAVSYYGRRTSGVILYRIEGGLHRLVGRLAAAGDDGDVYSETLTKLPPVEPPDPS